MVGWLPGWASRWLDGRLGWAGFGPHFIREEGPKIVDTAGLVGVILNGFQTVLGRHVKGGRYQVNNFLASCTKPLSKLFLHAI